MGEGVGVGAMGRTLEMGSVPYSFKTPGTANILSHFVPQSSFPRMSELPFIQMGAAKGRVTRFALTREARFLLAGSTASKSRNGGSAQSPCQGFGVASPLPFFFLPGSLEAPRRAPFCPPDF